MKAISLWQPWATAWVIGSKLNETRHWRTDYRGPLAIHAAQRRVASELRDYATDPAWVAAMSRAGWAGDPDRDIASLPFGAIIGVLNVTGCYPTDLMRGRGDIYLPQTIVGIPGEWCEDDMGNYGPGRFAWAAADRRLLPTPIPYRGRQSFFSIPDDILPPAFRP